MFVQMSIIIFISISLSNGFGCAMNHCKTKRWKSTFWKTKNCDTGGGHPSHNDDESVAAEKFANFLLGKKYNFFVQLTLTEWIV
jgi:hypothetical protein